MLHLSIKTDLKRNHEDAMAESSGDIQAKGTLCVYLLPVGRVL